jgi:cell division protein ZapE
LYLWGGVGRGKTWLMDLFFASLPFSERRRRHFHRFMHDVHDELKRLKQQRSPLDHIAAAIARDTRVLCFYELFVSDIADAMILRGLLQGLLRRGVTLVATSNVPPRELYQDGLQRQRFLPVIALLEQQLEVLPVAGPSDYRLRQLRQAGTYLVAGATDEAARLDALFRELGGAGAQQGGTLQIEGRPIAVIRVGHGAVWCAFGALCAGPRSQNDYIEIAREFQAVFVSHVPVLDAEHEDEARRFVALVDELYDRNVKLVVSAAAAPAQLYQGTRVRALFARTVSRLTEMQSEEYLARQHRP